MAYRQYWDHWRHVQTWLKAAEYAKRRAEEDKTETLRQLQINGNPCDPPGGFTTVMPNATYPPPSSSFFDLVGASEIRRKSKRRVGRKPRERRNGRKREKDNVESMSDEEAVKEE